MLKIDGNERSRSLMTNCELEDVFTLPDFPIHMLSEGDPSNDLCCDMIFSIGVEDGFIELRKTVSPEILYKDRHSNAIGAMWRGAHEAVARLIQDNSTSASKILEIGGGTGKLNQIFNEIGGACNKWTIIEPQPLPVEGCTAEFVKGFFPEDLQNEKFDMVIHTHYFEHVENIQTFLEDVTRFLQVGGKMIFALPDMEPMLDKYMTSIIHFEHTFLITEKYLDFILNRNGFTVDEKQHFGNGQSLIYVTTYLGVKAALKLPDGLYETNRAILKDYFCYHKEMIQEYNRKLNAETRACYLFGAHMTTQFFVAYGLNMEKIEAILDNDTNKYGKRVGGTDKKILSPECLKDAGEVVVILPNSPYAKEIKTDILSHINSRVEFWE